MACIYGYIGFYISKYYFKKANPTLFRHLSSDDGPTMTVKSPSSTNGFISSPWNESISSVIGKVTVFV
jgi:hypothetical protein